MSNFTKAIQQSTGTGQWMPELVSSGVIPMKIVIEGNNNYILLNCTFNFDGQQRFYEMPGIPTIWRLEYFPIGIVHEYCVKQCHPFNSIIANQHIRNPQIYDTGGH